MGPRSSWYDVAEEGRKKRSLGSRAVIFMRRWVYQILTAPQFDMFMGLIIFTNVAAIGAEQSSRLAGHSVAIFEYMEYVFLIVYTLEVALQLYVWGTRCLVVRSVQFDILLVVVGIATTWVIPAIVGDADESGGLSALRFAKLLRLWRAARLLVMFPELWVLLRGLVNLGSTMVYALMLILFALYVFSCISLEIVTNHRFAVGPQADPGFQALVEQHFSTLPLTMLTLMQFVSFDNIVLVYQPLVVLDWPLIFFFALVIFVLGIALMNLITAVIVNSALEQAMEDKDMQKAAEVKKRKMMVKELRDVFIRLDMDQSGYVSKAELEMADDADRAVLHELLSTTDYSEIFAALDVDNSGSLSIDEFCDGLWHASTSKASIETRRAQKIIDLMRQQFLHFGEVQAQLARDVASIRGGPEAGHRECSAHVGHDRLASPPADTPLWISQSLSIQRAVEDSVHEIEEMSKNVSESLSIQRAVEDSVHEIKARLRGLEPLSPGAAEKPGVPWPATKEHWEAADGHAEDRRRPSARARWQLSLEQMVGRRRWVATAASARRRAVSTEDRRRPSPYVAGGECLSPSQLDNDVVARAPECDDVAI